MNLFDPQPNYANHDTFLFAILGMASARDELLTLLDNVRGRSVTDMDSVSGQPDPHQEQFALAILGLVSLAEQFQRIIDDWKVPIAQTSAMQQ